MVISSAVKTQKFSWLETDTKLWNGECPSIEIEVNLDAGFIYTALIVVNTNRSPLRERAMLQIFLMDLTRSHVLEPKYGGVDDIMRGRRNNALRAKEDAGDDEIELGLGGAAG